MSGTITAAAAACAAGAAWLWCGRDTPPHRTRPPAVLRTPHPERRRLRAARRARAALTPEVACAAAGLAAGLLTHSPLPALAGAAGVPLVRRRGRRSAERRAARARRTAVVDLCTALAGELRAGRPPHAALAGALARGGGIPQSGAETQPMTAVLAAARFGSDVPAALRRAGRLPGAEGLAGVAACWEVAVDGGGGLAEGLERVAAALRREQDQREELAAQLAGPRSTAVLLAVLPVFGLVLGAALGARPLRILLHTPAGLACLAAGTALECAGIAWTARIVRTAAGEAGPL
ncbi:hypothetical protein GQS52_13570 [Streptomyces sp. SCUT-3]|uniref:type II secretion system F family protein n=1 Tax=Streptomyces sp. SCUT-3 TaxID=2684469 RepID=UPI0015FB6E34|nr:type II secretion system F family protein [Streptomyces sp. SCUT-3]QMV22635.1 hypothetical protein GQS52_13570 [Streptomyces sp. SCUT-3]